MWGYKIMRSFFRSILRIGRTKTALNVIAVDVDNGETLRAQVNSNNSSLMQNDSPFIRNLFQDYDSTIDNTEAIRISRASLASTLFINGEVIYWKPITYSDSVTSTTSFTIDTTSQDSTATVSDVHVLINGVEIPETGSTEADNTNNSFSYAVSGTDITIDLDRAPGFAGSPAWIKIRFFTKIVEVET
jgi:hypothetical protein